MEEISVFEEVQAFAKSMGVDFAADEFASLAIDKGIDDQGLAAIREVFDYLSDKKASKTLETLLRLSRLPQKNPKTFENFDFDRLHGEHVAEVRKLPTLAALYGHRNLAFIGPEGIGKTHLAQAFGHACCHHGMKSYFLKATELNDRFVKARREGREARVISSLVKPSCLIIDEMGRCQFDVYSTNMFFDLIDRRYQKEGPSTMIFTSNYGADQWKSYFSEDSALLCSLDRAFDDAIVFQMKGQSYRGRKLERYAIEAGAPQN